MPAQRTFDGDTLEAALARVTHEHGADARIISAEKVLSGGIAGFFARERFELLVELPEEPRSHGNAPAAALAAPATSILDLADQVSDAERHAAPVAEAPEPVRPVDAHYTPSTEGRTFQDVLRGLLREADLPRGEVGPAQIEAAPLDVTPEPAALAVVEPTRATAEPVAAPAPLALPSAEGRPRRARPHAALRSSLHALGIQRDLLAGVTVIGSDAQQVLGTLEQLLVPPPPLIVGAGEVVVVVGDQAVALEAAAVAAAQLGQSPTDVVVARPGRASGKALRGPDEVAARRRGWQDGPTVVALCAGDGPRGRAWAAEMIAALEPVAVWGAVRADRKPEDVRTWVAAIGGVTALAVGECAETVSPAAMLGAGLPIAVVEGRRSTPAAWTALLVERLGS